MNRFKCSIPDIVFGSGNVGMIAEHAAGLGSKVLLAIDPYWVDRGLAERIADDLRRSDVGCVPYSSIEPNPSCFSVDKAAAVAVAERCDCVVAVGGGSAIDFGKGVAVMAVNPGTCWEYTDRKDHTARVPSTVLPIVAVPTTAGTGAEVTPFAVFNHPKLREKSSIVSSRIHPRVAVVDPELSKTMDSRLTGLSGIDALAHSLEGYISKNATVFSRMISIESLRLITAHLPVAVKDGENMEAREALSWASTLGGIVVGHVGGTLPHAIGQPVSGLTGAPHGASIAACMVTILDRSCDENPALFAGLAEALDRDSSMLSERERARSCPGLVGELFASAGVSERYSSYGLREEDIDRVTRMAFTCYPGAIQRHPKLFTEAEIRDIYRASL